MHLQSLEVQCSRFPDRDAYPFHLPIFGEDFDLPFTSPVTFFCGENGAGKSTLLKAAARSAGIHIWQGVSTPTYHKNPYENKLHLFTKAHWRKKMVPGSFFSADIFRNFVQILDEWASTDPGVLKYFGDYSLSAQSHGQSLMSFFRNRYNVEGLYLLDEPETALSPKHLIELLQILNETGRTGKAQFIISSHSPILLSCPEAVIYQFGKDGISKTRYRETEYYKVYKEFMNDPESFHTLEREPAQTVS